MKRGKFRVLAILIAVFMVIGLMPIVAMAAPGDELTFAPEPTAITAVPVGFTTAGASTVTLKNGDSNSITAVAVSLTGDNAANFDLAVGTLDDLDAGTIAANSSATVTVTPKASANLDVGTHTVTVSVDGTANSGAFTGKTVDVSFEVTNNATGPSSATTFTSAIFGKEETETFNVTHVTDGTAITGLAVAMEDSDSPFDVSITPDNIDTGAAATVTVKVKADTPVTGNEISDNVVITGTGLGETIKAQVKATVTNNLAVNASTVAFTQAYGETETPVAIDVENLGKDIANGTAITLEIVGDGTDAEEIAKNKAAFELSADSITSGIVSGATDSTVTVKPASATVAVGTYSAKVVVSSTGFGKSEAVPVTLAVTDNATATPNDKLTIDTAVKDYTNHAGNSVVVANVSTEAIEEIKAELIGDDAAKFDIIAPTTPADFDISASGNDTVTVKPNDSLAVGEYKTTLKISSDNLSKTFEIPVEFKVVEAITADVEEVEIDTRAENDYSASAIAMPIELTNATNNSLGVEVTLEKDTETPFALNAVPASVSGNSAATFSVAPKNDNLLVGTYEDVIIVKSIVDPAAFEEIRIPVTFEVIEIAEVETDMDEPWFEEVGYIVSDLDAMIVTLTNNMDSTDLTNVKAKVSNDKFVVSPSVSADVAPGEANAQDFEVLPVDGLGVGFHTAVLMISYAEGETIAVDLEFEVYSVLDSIDFDETEIEMKTGDVRLLTGTLTPDDAIVAFYEWESSDSKVASVDFNGIVTAIEPGTAEITVTATDVVGNEVSDTCTITVSASGTLEESTPEEFVERLYNLGLGRDTSSDPSAKEWVTHLKSGASTGADAAYGIVFSDEFIANDYTDEEFVNIMYEMMLGRPANPDEIAAWVEALEMGASRKQVFAGFANSMEFKRTCALAWVDPGQHVVTPSVADFVHRFYKVGLGRAPEAQGLGEWCTALLSNQANGRQIGYGVFFSPEFEANNYSNDEFVDKLYQAFLGRPADAEGKAAWVGLLNQGETKQQVFDGFAYAVEFCGICAAHNVTPY